MANTHTCHAIDCETTVPPRLHMCARHWRMVPQSTQRALWAAYRKGQERDKQPSAAYLRAAAACISVVASAEGIKPEKIAASTFFYEEVAAQVESGSLW